MLAMAFGGSSLSLPMPSPNEPTSSPFTWWVHVVGTMAMGYEARRGVAAVAALTLALASATYRSAHPKPNLDLNPDPWPHLVDHITDQHARCSAWILHTLRHVPEPSHDHLAILLGKL